MLCHAVLQAIVRPYLDSKYQIRGIVQRPLGTLFGSLPGMSFRKWLFLWLSQLVQHHASGAPRWLALPWGRSSLGSVASILQAETSAPHMQYPICISGTAFWSPHPSAGAQVKLFQSVIPVFRFDIPTSLFLMPYLVHNVLAHGSDLARQGAQQELRPEEADVDCVAILAQAIRQIVCHPLSVLLLDEPEIESTRHARQCGGECGGGRWEWGVSGCVERGVYAGRPRHAEREGLVPGCLFCWAPAAPCAGSHAEAAW